MQVTWAHGPTHLAAASWFAKLALFVGFVQLHAQCKPCKPMCLDPVGLQERRYQGSTGLAVLKD